MKQDDLRKQCRLVKAYDKDIDFIDIAGVIGISIHSFYNWLNGSYSLSYKKEKELEEWLSGMLGE